MDKWDISNKCARNASETDECIADCVPESDTSSTPETGESLAACVSASDTSAAPDTDGRLDASDTSSAPETDGHLAVCVSVSDESSAPEMDGHRADCVSASDTSILPEADGRIATYISASDKSSAIETDGHLAVCVSAKDASTAPEMDVARLAACISAYASNTPETECCTHGREYVLRAINILLESSKSTDDPVIIELAKKVRDFRKNIIQLLESIHSKAMELDCKDFMQVAEMVRNSPFPPIMIFDIKKSMRQYEKKIKMEDYKETLDNLNKFNYFFKDYEDTEEIFYSQIPKMLAFAKVENILPEEMHSEYINISKERKDIDKRLAKYKSIDILGIVEFMKSLRETRILSEVLISYFKNLADELKELRILIDYQNKKMCDISDKLLKIAEKNPKKNSNTMIISKQNFDKLLNSGTNVSFAVHEGTIKLKKTDEKSKSKICTLEHNVPFCGNCGWRTSWLKAFKKRGVHVKEDASGTNENIWYNKVNNV